MNDVIKHYDGLIDENNDPVRDPQFLKSYMDKWDGSRFIESMQLDESKSVLEIGVGPGRLAIKTAPVCKRFCGIDISPKTIQRAYENLSSYHNIKLVCGDFMTFEFDEQFDVIYSSLTFMHIKDKEGMIEKTASLLNNDGLFVLSIDKNQSEYIDMGIRRLKIYPDNPADTYSYILKAKLQLVDKFETDYAYVTVSRKASFV